MCGIIGVYNRCRPVAAGVAKLAADALRHRGPDDEGFLAVDTAREMVWHLVGADSQVEGERIEAFAYDVNLFLGHRRLSIIDPSPAGHQPMATRDEALWIVFNGEIYNYLELRAELLRLGYPFRTHGDTEVILAAYETWGAECVNRFNGMWAFVIYDRRKGILFGSRDRFGVKPLYYCRADGGFSFASEIKALLQLPFVEKRVNHAAVFDYLVMGLEEHEEEGFFRGIYELKPSHNFEVDLRSGSFRKWRYYTLPYVDRWERFDPAKALDHVSAVRELIFDAVRLRLRSDVAVGSCLSGGVDSSTIVCVINELLGRERLEQVGDSQKVFTACYDQAAIDESSWAELVVSKTRTAWHRTYPKADELLHDLEDLVYTQDIPFGSTSIYAQYRVMRLAQESGVKVVLDGQGGDELFSGYITYYRAFYAEMIASRDFRRLQAEIAQLANSPIAPRALLASVCKLYLLRHLPSPLRKFLQKVAARENRYIAREFWHANRSRLDLAKEMGTATLNGMLHQYITGRNLKPLLKYEDRNSMRFSIESRTPFADDIQLIEYLFQVPSCYKIHDGWSKFLLRGAASGVLPEEIRTRKDKLGFATPEYFWLNDLAGAFREYLDDGLSPFLDVKSLRADWDSLIRGRATSGSSNIWKIINLAVWFRVNGLVG